MADDYSGDIIDAAHWLRAAYTAAQREDWAAMANVLLEAVKHTEKAELWARRKVRDSQ